MANTSESNSSSAVSEAATERTSDDNVRRIAPRVAAGEVAKLEPSSRRGDGTKSADRPAAASAAETKRSMKRRLLFAALPVALVVGGYFYVTGGATMSTDNAYVQADIVGVSNDISGIVKDIVVRDNQNVAKGDVLFRLDDEPFRLALERADAQLGMVRNDLLAMRTKYKDMQAQIEQAKADVALNNLTVERQQKLAANNYTAQATLDAARNTLIASQQKLASLNQQLDGIAVDLNGNPDAPVEEHPRYKDALAARGEAQRQLSHTVVKAPFAGVVTNVPSLQSGQYLAAAATAFNIVSTDHVWVEASPKETELTSVEPGQKVTVTVDTYPGQRWTGTVESISPASASSFSLLPAENSSGNWVKVVQRIPMRVRVENEPGKPQLRVGMSVEVDVDTGHPRGFPTFLTDLFGSSGANRG
ncbi:HlyD family secretion protein [Hyphomicrobium sp. 99]|uniref:HlyD family secretion protein n=1 Tax=Hyphomicrobium sp. 99 TaxID=1163419 RepID=UPI0005F8111C|nr:HlyD family secretion protein [Hyphomicrobium sp. 99]